MAVRPEVEKTQRVRPVWHHPRVHLLDDTWLLIIVAILVATALPWLTGGFDVDIGMVTWGLLALGGIHVGFALLGAPNRAPGKWYRLALSVLCLIGVGVIGFIWRHAGALRNPIFPMVFALPVVSSIFLSRWHPYLLALAGVSVTVLVALSQSPELRWYAAGLTGSDVWLIWLFGARNDVPQASFVGLFAPSSYAVLLEVFAVLLFACAFVAEYLGGLFERLNARSVSAQVETQSAQALWAALIEQLPVPVILVDPDTLDIVAASELAQTSLRVDPMPLAQAKLFDAVHFSYPDMVQELVVGDDGTAPRTVIHVGEQVRMCEVRVTHIAHQGHRLALLTVQDATELFHARTVLDTSEYAALLIDARGIILTFNQPATALFGNLAVGMDAGRLLQIQQGAQLWWEPGLSGRSKLLLEIGPRLFQVTSSAILLPGEEHRVFAVSLLPVAQAEANDPYGTGSTRRISVLRPLR